MKSGKVEVREPTFVFFAADIVNPFITSSVGCQPIDLCLTFERCDSATIMATFVNIANFAQPELSHHFSREGRAFKEKTVQMSETSFSRGN